jgi:hypothetical protein
MYIHIYIYTSIGEWIWIAQCLVTSWRTIMHLSDTDEDDLRFLISCLKSKDNDCENSLKGKKPWESSHVMRYLCIYGYIYI